MASRSRSRIIARGTIRRSRRLTGLTALAIMAWATLAVPHAGVDATLGDELGPGAVAAIEVDVRPTRQVSPGPTGTAAAGPAVAIGATAWHDAGFTGDGVRVGVIDFFDLELYWDEAVLGPRPVAGSTARCFDRGADCTGDFYDGVDDGGEDHGVAVAELIQQVAPDAEIFIGQATTIADYTALVDWFASQGVRVLNRSLGSRYDGPGDGRGALDDVARAAVGQGITWINSAGNNGEGKYYRHRVRLVGDRVALGSGGDDTFLEATGCISLAGMRWSNDWDRPAGERTDYDLFVWESPTGDPAPGTVVASSQVRQTAGAPPLEFVPDRCPAPGTSLYLEIRWLGGDTTGDVIEILDYGNGFAEHTVAPSSAAVSVVDADLAGVVSVGAIDPPDSGEIGPYSSQGPTNDGRIAPSVATPSGFTSTVFGATFAGTSAAAAVATGAAAVLLDAGLASDAISLGDLIRNTTVDRGEPGPDNVYGYGELRLPTPPPPPAAATPSRYVPLTVPIRALDTRPASAVGPPDLIGPTWAGEIRRLSLTDLGAVPDDATSVAVNIVTVTPDRRSYVQALPLWQSPVGGYSNLNTDAAGQNRANFAIVPVAADGTIALYTTASGHLVVDVLGWFEPAAEGVSAGRFVELPAAQRLLDTRTDSAAPVASDTTLPVPNPTGLPTGDVDALVVTVTAVRPTSVGWLQAFPAGRDDVIGATSTVNTSAGSTAANTAIVPIGAEGLAVHASFFAGGTSHVVVDAIGYITGSSAPNAAAGRYVSVDPGRAFDSRTTGRPLDDGRTIVVDASTAPGVAVPADAAGVMWNLTIVNATRRGFASGWADGAPRPATSVLNWSLAGEVRAAAAVTAVVDGSARFTVDDEGAPETGALGHLLVDVFGYFT